MKKALKITLFGLFLSLFLSPTPLRAQSALEFSDVRYLTTADFKFRVFNYTTDSIWHYLGETPCVIDLYADWCGPCRRLAPIMAELAEDYCDQVIFYKINVDREKELAYYFQASSIPMLVFVPVHGLPQVARGLLPKETLQQAINEILLTR